MAPAVWSYSVSLIAFCSAFFVATQAQPTHRSPLDPTKRSGVLGAYSVPLSNGTTSLPSAVQPSSIKAITIGRGVQNYTCASSTSADVPKAIGAIAILYDTAEILAYVPPVEGVAILEILPSLLLDFSIATLSHSALPRLGQHYFNAAASPVFDLTSSNNGLLVGNKTGDIAAPSDSTVGPNGVGNGAVDWLALTSKTGSTELVEAYRVYTAGGKAPATCNGQNPTLEIQYAAQYWFFG